MHKENIIAKAREIFQNLTPVSESLYKGEFLRGTETASAVFYMDFTKDLDVVDFKKHQENIIAADYYNQAGFIQWNYYLLMFPETVSSTTKREIEKDGKFARKYIFTESEFTKFFTASNIKPSAVGNLVNEIKNKLDKVDLQEIYGDASLKSVFERFKRDETVKLVSDKDFAVELDIERINSIDAITLNPNFRKYPDSKREFKFSKVNLISGTNGVGKTSLLEGVELIIAGKTLRNPDVKEPDGCVEALINGTYLERVKPSFTERYRRRDLAWYSKSYVRSNEMDASFNQYNYFNSDAGMNIALGTDESEIDSALKNLVLGPEYNHISERLKTFYDYFRPEFNKLKTQVTDLETRIEYNQVELDALKLNNSFNEQLARLESHVGRVKINMAQFDPTKDIQKLELATSRLLNLLGRIYDLDPTILSISSINSQQINLSKKAAAYEDFLKRDSEITTATEKLREAISNLQHIKDLLDRNIKYLAHPQYNELYKLAYNFDALNSKLEMLNEFEGTFTEEFFISIDPDTSIEVASNKVVNRLQTIDAQIIGVQRSKNVLSRSLTEHAKNLSDVLSAAEKYIRNLDGIDHCPVCDSEVSRHQLLESLKKPVTTTSLGSSFTRIDRELAELNLKKEELLERNSKLASAQKFVKNLFPDRGDMTVSDLIFEFNVLKNQKFELILEIESLRHLENEISNSNSLSIDEFKFMHRQSDANTLNIDAIDLTSVEDERNRVEDQLFHLHGELGRFIYEQNKHSKEIASLFEVGNSSSFRPQITAIYNRESALSKKMLELCEELKSAADIDEGSSFSTLQVELEVLMTLISQIKTDDSKLQLAKRLNEQIDSSKSSLARLTPLMQRFQNAGSLISELIENDGSKGLKDFFKQNMDEVSEIFQIIHQPREFKKISFEKNKLILTTNSGALRNTNQVSTGQRSAIALSIFLTLNRKLSKGPNIIMFDDPVAYIDDMNILSFLDYLRFFVLKEGKQIFFATANKKLASLFQKKFAYLDQGFNTIEIERN